MQNVSACCRDRAGLMLRWFRWRMAGLWCVGKCLLMSHALKNGVDILGSKKSNPGPWWWGGALKSGSTQKSLPDLGLVGKAAG